MITVLQQLNYSLVGYVADPSSLNLERSLKQLSVQLQKSEVRQQMQAILPKKQWGGGDLKRDIYKTLKEHDPGFIAQMCSVPSKVPQTQASIKAKQASVDMAIFVEQIKQLLDERLPVPVKKQQRPLAVAQIHDKTNTAITKLLNHKNARIGENLYYIVRKVNAYAFDYSGLLKLLNGILILATTASKVVAPVQTLISSPSNLLIATMLQFAVYKFLTMLDGPTQSVQQITREQQQQISRLTTA